MAGWGCKGSLMKRCTGGTWVVVERQLLSSPLPASAQLCASLMGRCRRRAAGSCWLGAVCCIQQPGSKGPQPVTSLEAFNTQPWSRVYPRDPFPFPNIKNPKLCQLDIQETFIPFYSFNSLANCNAVFVRFLIHSDFVLIYSLFFKAISLWCLLPVLHL